MTNNLDVEDLEDGPIQIVQRKRVVSGQGSGFGEGSGGGFSGDVGSGFGVGFSVSSNIAGC